MFCSILEHSKQHKQLKKNTPLKLQKGTQKDTTIGKIDIGALNGNKWKNK
jgi:hypothetical protein